MAITHVGSVLQSGFSNSDPPAINLPGSPAEGDLVLTWSARVNGRDPGAIQTSGYTSLYDTSWNSGSLRWRLYYKIIGSGETTVDWGTSGSFSDYRQTGVHVYRNVDTTTPVVGNAQTTGTSATAPTLSAPTAAHVALMLRAHGNPVPDLTFTGPTFTQRLTGNGGATSNRFAWDWVDDLTARSSMASASWANTSGVVSVALKEAPPPTTVVVGSPDIPVTVRQAARRAQVWITDLAGEQVAVLS